MNNIIIVSTFIFVVLLYDLYYIRKKLISLENKIKEIEAINHSQNVSLVRLMYHKSIELEDYEATKVITDNMPKDFNFNKLM